MNTVVSPVRASLWLVLAAVAGTVLALQVWATHRGTLEMRERTARIDREISKLEQENRRLRLEREAAEADPYRVEILMRRRPSVSPGERILTETGK